MKPFDLDVLDELEAGNVDYRDAVELVLDSGLVRMVIGMRGQFAWDDEDGLIPVASVLPEEVYYGGGALIELELPESSIGPLSRAVVARVAETYLTEGSDIPVNVFDDGVRATIDEEEWEGRPAVLSIFWMGSGGTPIYREQVAIRTLDSMSLDWDSNGVPVRSLVMEEPDIAQRDIEGKTSNATFQSLIDPTDKAFEHVGQTQNQKINFGRVSEDAS